MAQLLVPVPGPNCLHPLVVDERDPLSEPENPAWIRSCALCAFSYDRTERVLWPLREKIRAKYGLPERYVICPGALIAAKGPQNVVAAAKEFADLAPVVFIGDGDLRDELEAELGDRGRFLGFVSQEDKVALINAATVLTAAPEKLEHFGIIYIEALAAGTVPVAYRGGGVDSIVSQEVGVLTERSPNRLGRAIRRVLEDHPRARTMAIAGRKRAENEYAASKLGDRLARWLEQSVASRGEPPG